MANFSIGLSGLQAAQTAMEIIANNVANAATDGYHRQRVEFAPVTVGPYPGGVDVAGVTRLIDTFLESEITRQKSAAGQVAEELSLLNTVESTLGEFSDSGGLNATIDKFFDSLRALAAAPQEAVPRNEVVSAAQTLVSEFQSLGASLKTQGDQVVVDAHDVVDSINQLTGQIADLNGKIQSIEISQGPSAANNLCDQRDRLIGELAHLAGIETQPREHGVVDVALAGVPVVTGAIPLDLRVDLSNGLTLTVWADGAEGGNVEVEGGKLGGLLALKNDLLGGIRTEVDTLAKAIVEEVNRWHVQGLGQFGSFQELIGSPMADMDLAALGAGVTDGTFYIRVTNTTTGEVQRHAVTVNTSGVPPETPTSLAAKIDALDGLSASINSSRLYLTADPGYTFDFLPAVLSQPTATNLTAAAPPTVSISGLYEGEQNHVLTFTAVGSGSIGNGDLQLRVADENGDLVGTLNVGSGYAAGDVLELTNGLQITVGAGDLNAGDSFGVEALATTDSSGFLAAAGLNTFFSGATASEMRVCDAIVAAPDRIATAFGGDLVDNIGALRLAGVRDQPVDRLGGMTPGEYYQRLVADLGQEVALRQGRQQNLDAVLQSLGQQRDDVSAVNVNDEAAQLLVLQQIFQAVAKYMSALQTTMTTLMDTL